MDILKLIPPESFFPLIGSLVATTFALALVVAELRHRLKRAEDEASSAKSDITVLNKKYEEEISNIKELHVREGEELRNTITELSNQSHKVPPYEIKYFSIDKYTWETKIYKNGNFEVDKYPFCIQHNLRFIYDNEDKRCPHVENFKKCNNSLNKSDEFRIYQSAQSIIEREIRNKSY